MSLTTIFVILLCVVLLIIVVAYIFRPNDKFSPPPNIDTWFYAPSDNPLKNTCQLYSFPAQRYNGRYVFPSPNLNTLDVLQGTTVYPSCLAPNQVIAQEITRTCNSSGCIDRNGNNVPVGTTETYYKSCSIISPCNGSQSLLSINYNPGINVCITNDNGNAIMSPCDPTDERQVMQITRTEVGVDPSSLQGGGGLRGMNGTVRNGNVCLQGGDVLATANNTCSSGTQRQGKNLVFGPCNASTSTLRFIPAHQVCPAGKTPFDVCCDSTGPDCPGGVVTGNAARIIPCCTNAPPQIQVGDEAAYYGGAGALILTTPSTNDSGCEGKNFVARSINTATYEQSLIYPPCITGVSYCNDL